MLIFAASEVETASLAAGISPGFAGLLGGMTGGVAQAYATMGRFSMAYLLFTVSCVDLLWSSLVNVLIFSQLTIVI